MSKIKELPQFTSLTDMANQFATEDDKAGIFVRHSAQYAVSKGVTSDKVSDEQKAELSDGFRLRFNSNNPVKQYRKEGDDVYVPMEKGDTGIGIDVAMSYTTHAFGQLKGTRPNFHGIIKAWRDGFSTYSSQKLGRLIAAIKAIENENAGVTKTRAPNAEFTVYVAKALDGIKINKAVDAFKMALL